MKICIVSTSIFPSPPPNYSGLEMVAYQQAVGLAKLGHEVTLIAPEGSSCPGGEVFVTGPAGVGDERKSYDKYWQKLLEFDAIIDHSWQKWSYVLKMEGKLKAPILGVMHAPVNTMYSELPPVEKPCMVCISEDQANHFRALFNKDCRRAYNGIDLDFYQSSGVPRTDRFLFLARFSAIKGPLIAQSVCKAANVSLDLVGDTTITNEPEYYQACVQQADGKQIKILGPASRGECIHWFSQARGLIHSAKPFREPFGLAPVEAQACGTPVLSFDNGACRETIKHGETGFVVKTEEEMVNILQSGAMDGLSRRRCREWASQFSVEVMSKRYESLCIEAIDTGGW